MAIGRIPEPGTGIPESIIAAKGDLIVGTANDTPGILSVGTNGHTLVADSSVSPTGLKWAVDPVADVITTAGDLIYGTAADTVARLGIGTAGQVLQVNSGATAPEWAAPAGGSTYAGVSVQKTAQQTLTSGTFTLVSWNIENFDTDAYHDNSTNNSRITIPTGKGGKYLLSGGLRFTSGSAAGNRAATLYKNGIDLNYIFFQPPTTTTNDNVQPFSFVVSLTAGDYLQLYAYQNSGTTLNLDNLSYWQVSYLGA